MTTVFIIVALLVGAWIGFGVGMITIGLMMRYKEWDE